MGRGATIVFSAVVLVVLLVGCEMGGGGTIGDNRSQPSSTAGAGSVPLREGSPTESAQSPLPELTNDSWDLASQEADKYRGARVTLEGEVFNILSGDDGYHHFQVYTDPVSSTGNTHVKSKEDPRVKKGYQVRIAGTLSGTLVTRSVSGKELRIPQVEADSVEITGPPSIVTPTPTPTAVPTPTPTKVPTATQTARPATPAPTATGTPKPATPSPAPPTQPTLTAAPPSPTQAPPTSTPGATATPAPPPPTATSTAPASPPTAGSVDGNPGTVSIELSQAQLSGPIALGSDPSAAGGRYLYSTVGDQRWDGKGNPPPTGDATVQINAPKDGKYAVWVRMWYGHVDANSYWLIVDGQPAIKVGNDDAGYRQWKWVGWRDDSPSKRITVELKAGEHTVKLVGREAGTRADRLLVTDDVNLTPQ